LIEVKGTWRMPKRMAMLAKTMKGKRKAVRSARTPWMSRVTRSSWRLIARSRLAEREEREVRDKEDRYYRCISRSTG
jgi:hypothetical protein